MYTLESERFYMECIQYNPRVNFLVEMSTNVDTLLVFDGQLQWALIRFCVRSTNIRIDSF